MSETILSGDCRDTLKTIEAGTVHTVVTSPPYWGLRAYIDDPREIGREKTPDEHLANLIEVFREVRRVMRDDATLFLNYGDSYDNGNLLSMPHRVVRTLRNYGWYHRSTIVWSKKSPMPESVGGTKWVRCRIKVRERLKQRSNSQGQALYVQGDSYTGRNPDSSRDPDCNPVFADCPGCAKCQENGGYVLRMNAGRPTTSHEYVFMLTKSGSYFYNQDGNRVGLVSDGRGGFSNKATAKYSTNNCGPDGKPLSSMVDAIVNPAGRNLWTVWDDIKQSNYKGAHFATMPLDLAQRCVKLGTSDYGCCPTCGNQWAPVVETDRQPTRPATDNKRNGVVAGNTDPERHETQTNITEWRATCQCKVNEGGRPIVLDPFHGSGTTGEAARENGCDYIGCELNEEYIRLGAKRFEQQLLI